MRRSGLPPIVSYSIAVGGVSSDEEVFVTTVGLNESANETLRNVSFFDARNLATGVYPYNIRVTNNFAESRIGTDIAERAIVVNGQDSPFGAGWGVDGLARLHKQSDGSVLIVGGAGRAAIFDAGPTFISPDGDFTTLVENPDGTFTRTFTDGTRVEFNTAGLQTQVIDRNGNTTAYAYDAEERLTSITDPTGRQTQFEYAGARLMRVIDPDNRATVFGHDGRGDLTQVTFPDGTTRSFEYDANHLLVVETDARDFSTLREYNRVGQLTRASLPDGSVRQFTPIDSLGLVDPASGLGTETDPAPFLRTGDVESLFVDGAGRTRRSVTDRFGAAVVVEDAAGLTTRFIRNDAGLTTLRLAPNGADTRFEYDDRGNVLRVEEFGNFGFFDALRLTYEPDFNQIASITDARNRTTTLDYDASGNLSEVISPLGRSAQLSYDNRGLITDLLDPLSTPTAFDYDSRGNLAEIASGTGAGERITRLTYTPEGYVAGLIDPEGRAFGFTYDAQGRLTRQTLPDGRQIQMAYDGNGNVVGVTPPGRPQHRFDYSGVNLQSVYTPPNVGLPEPRTQFSYNLAQQLAQITRPDGQIVGLGYDSGGRLDTVTLPRGPVGFGYDGSGNLVSATAPSGIGLEYEYERDLLTDVIWTGPVAGRVEYVYDNDRRISNLSVNFDTVLYEYDDDGLLARAFRFVGETDIPESDLQFLRDPGSGLVTGTNINAVTTDHVYNDFAEPTQVTASVNGTSVYDVNYTRDKLGRITGKTETLGGSTTTFGYEYDLAGRLAEVRTNGAITANYEYDANGNRTRRNGVIGVYDAQDRLLSYDGAAYAYTANGELRTKTEAGATTTYTYDVLGNLTQAQLPGDVTIDYLIDAQNRRIGKQVNGVLVQGFLYQDELKPVAELDAAGNVVSHFVYGTKLNVPEFIIKGEDSYRIVSDHLGSPRLVINTFDGNIVQRMDYDEFGNVVLDTNPGFQPFGFAGGLYDLHSGLVRFGTRDYDPLAGRWTAKDLIGFDGGDVNLYLYVSADPINLVDRDGLQNPLSQLGIPPIAQPSVISEGQAFPQACRDTADCLAQCAKNLIIGEIEGQTGQFSLGIAEGAAGEIALELEARGSAIASRVSSLVSQGAAITAKTLSRISPQITAAQAAACLAGCE